MNGDGGGGLQVTRSHRFFPICYLKVVGQCEIIFQLVTRSEDPGCQSFGVERRVGGWGYGHFGGRRYNLYLNLKGKNRRKKGSSRRRNSGKTTQSYPRKRSRNHSRRPLSSVSK